MLSNTRYDGVEDILSGMSTSSVLELLFEDSLYTQAIRSAGLTGGYGRWVDKQIQTKVKSEGKVNLGFVTSTINLVKKFLEVQRSIKGDKDIFSYKTVEDLKRTLGNLAKPASVKDDPRQARSNPGLKLVYSDQGWEAFKALGHRALCSVGSRTSWCVVADKSHYDRYVRMGAQVYLLRTRLDPEDPEFRRYLIAVFPDGEWEVADERNNHLRAPELLARETGSTTYTKLSRVLGGLPSLRRPPRGISKPAESLMDSKDTPLEDVLDILSNPNYKLLDEFEDYVDDPTFDWADHLPFSKLQTWVKRLPDLEAFIPRDYSQSYLEPGSVSVVVDDMRIEYRYKGNTIPMPLVNNIISMDLIGSGFSDAFTEIVISKLKMTMANERLRLIQLLRLEDKFDQVYGKELEKKRNSIQYTWAKYLLLAIEHINPGLELQTTPSSQFKLTPIPYLFARRFFPREKSWKKIEAAAQQVYRLISSYPSLFGLPKGDKDSKEIRRINNRIYSDFLLIGSSYSHAVLPGGEYKGFERDKVDELVAKIDRMKVDRVGL